MFVYVPFYAVGALVLYVKPYIDVFGKVSVRFPL